MHEVHEMPWWVGAFLLVGLAALILGILTGNSHTERVNKINEQGRKQEKESKQK